VFFLQLSSEKLLILRRNEHITIINTYWTSHKVPVIVRFSWHENFLKKFFDKYSNTKISWKSIQWEPSCSMWKQLERHEKGSSCFSHFCEQAFKNSVFYLSHTWDFVHVMRSECTDIPYFPAYNARVIYTKRIWNRKKWTCAVYVKKISDW